MKNGKRNDSSPRDSLMITLLFVRDEIDSKHIISFITSNKLHCQIYIDTYKVCQNDSVYSVYQTQNMLNNGEQNEQTKSYA